MDWDHVTSWNAVARATLLQYKQFPLWNPFVNGGNVFLAHPHSCFLSPYFFFIVFFGVIPGLKVQILVSLFIGLAGMYVLSREFNLEIYPSYLSSFIFMLCSIFPLHIAEGHTGWLPMSFLPWLLYAYIQIVKKRKMSLRGIAVLSLMLLSGSVDIVSISLIFFSLYAIFLCIQMKNLYPLKVLFILFAGTFFCCSIKLIPMLEFLHHVSREGASSEGHALSKIFMILLSRKQAELYVQSLFSSVPGFPLLGWHEFGAYVGMIPIIFYLIGVSKSGKKFWPLIITGFICLLASFGDQSPFNLWGAISRLPIYRSLTTPSRYIVGFMLTFSILSGFGLSRLEKWSVGWNRRLRFLVPFITLFVLIDLWYVNSKILRNAFIVSPVQVERNHVFRQRYREDLNLSSKSRSSIYPVFLSNSGLLKGYEVMYIERGEVSIESDPHYRGEVYLERGQGTVAIDYFSPNKIIVDVDAKEADVLTVNQNHFKGWRVRCDGESRSSEAHKGLISARVEPGKNRITFYYFPRCFLFGLLVSGLYIIAVIAWHLKREKQSIPTFLG